MKPIATVRSIHGKRFPQLPTNRRIRGRHLFVALLIGLAAFLLHSGLSNRQEESPSLTSAPLDYPDFFAMRSEYLERFSTIHHAVHHGESLRQIFQRHGLPADSFADWGKTCSDLTQLSQLQPGDEVTIKLGAGQQEPAGFTVALLEGSTYTFLKTASGWECSENAAPMARITEAVGGVVTDGFYDSCTRAGLAPELVMELADLFACSIDFNTEIQNGDTFAAHFEEQVKDGKRVRIGPILAAEIRTGGRFFQAFLHELPDGVKGYFNPEGKSMARVFLRSPLSFSRISSAFSGRHLQPIRLAVQPNLGIDYTAPPGTPVSALGDGIVTFASRRSKSGRTVEIRHGNELKTSYGRLSSLTKGLKLGAKVTQGDVIGYVGSSGSAAGPRLDFRLYQRGKPVDFLKTEFPSLRSIPQSLRADFDKKREAYQIILRSCLSGAPAAAANTASGNE